MLISYLSVISENVKLGEPSLPVVTEDAKLRELLATLVGHRLG